MSRFCRHNRLTTQCPICSRETAPAAPPRPARAQSRSRRASGAARSAPATRSRGPFASVGPYEDAPEVRLERVPGGLRLAAWHGGEIARRAPVIAAEDVARLLADAAAKELLERPPVAPVPEPEVEPAPTSDSVYGASPGRSGELRDELRVERFDRDRVRVARWLLRPNAGWELQEAPVMLPPTRFAQAFEAAARKGVLTSGRAG